MARQEKVTLFSIVIYNALLNTRQSSRGFIGWGEMGRRKEGQKDVQDRYITSSRIIDNGFEDFEYPRTVK